MQPVDFQMNEFRLPLVKPKPPKLSILLSPARLPGIQVVADRQTSSIISCFGLIGDVLSPVAHVGQGTKKRPARIEMPGVLFRVKTFLTSEA